MQQSPSLTRVALDTVLDRTRLSAMCGMPVRASRLRIKPDTSIVDWSVWTQAFPSGGRVSSGQIVEAKPTKQNTGLADTHCALAPWRPTTG